jgi:hypothetical protein
MNERIKELAEQAQLYDFVIEAMGITEELERFVELVRQDEREACAKLCEDQIKSYISKQYTTDPDRKSVV